MKAIKILVWRSKYGDVYVAARNNVELERACLCIFKMMDESNFYDYENDPDSDEAVWYKEAKAGSARSAARLIDARRYGEYEQVDFEHIMVP